jgi:hypothetical protein
MNQISCLFLSEDIFIINICNDYKSIGDANLVDNIKTCINFNKNLNSKDVNKNQNFKYLLNCNIQENEIKKYKGIIIVKNLETFSSEYVIVDCFIKNKLLQTLSLDDTLNKNDYNFIQFLNINLQKNIINANIAYYNSLFNGDTYLYSLDSRIKLDFDILIYNFFQIIEKESIENIEIIMSL